MTLTQAHIELLRQLEAKPQVSSVRLPPECHDLEQTGYAKFTPLNLQVSRVEITLDWPATSSLAARHPWPRAMTRRARKVASASSLSFLPMGPRRNNDHLYGSKFSSPVRL
jgi:hypothetical protein